MLCRKLFCSLKKKFMINFFVKFSCRNNLCMKNSMYEEGSVDKNSVGILCCRFNLCVGIISVGKNYCRNNPCREMLCRKLFCSLKKKFMINFFLKNFLVGITSV